LTWILVILTNLCTSIHAQQPLALKTATDNLIYAIAKGDQMRQKLPLPQALISTGLSSDDAFPVPMTPLVAAIVAQSSNLEKWLVSKGADPAAKKMLRLRWRSPVSRHLTT